MALPGHNGNDPPGEVPMPPSPEPEEMQADEAEDGGGGWSDEDVEDQPSRADLEGYMEPFGLQMQQQPASSIETNGVEERNGMNGMVNGTNGHHAPPAALTHQLQNAEKKRLEKDSTRNWHSFQQGMENARLRKEKEEEERMKKEEEEEKKAEKARKKKEEEDAERNRKDEEERKKKEEEAAKKRDEDEQKKRLEEENKKREEEDARKRNEEAKKLKEEVEKRKKEQLEKEKQQKLAGDAEKKKKEDAENTLRIREETQRALAELEQNNYAPQVPRQRDNRSVSVSSRQEREDDDDDEDNEDRRSNVSSTRSGSKAKDEISPKRKEAQQRRRQREKEEKERLAKEGNEKPEKVNERAENARLQAEIAMEKKKLEEEELIKKRRKDTLEREELERKGEEERKRIRLLRKQENQARKDSIETAKREEEERERKRKEEEANNSGQNDNGETDEDPEEDREQARKKEKNERRGEEEKKRDETSDSDDSEVPAKKKKKAERTPSVDSDAPKKKRGRPRKHSSEVDLVRNKPEAVQSKKRRTIESDSSSADEEMPADRSPTRKDSNVSTAFSNAAAPPTTGSSTAKPAGARLPPPPPSSSSSSSSTSKMSGNRDKSGGDRPVKPQPTLNTFNRIPKRRSTGDEKIPERTSIVSRPTFMGSMSNNSSSTHSSSSHQSPTITHPTHIFTPGQQPTRVGLEREKVAKVNVASLTAAAGVAGNRGSGDRGSTDERRPTTVKQPRNKLKPSPLGDDPMNGSSSPLDRAFEGIDGQSKPRDPLDGQLELRQLKQKDGRPQFQLNGTAIRSPAYTNSPTSSVDSPQYGRSPLYDRSPRSSGDAVRGRPTQQVQQPPQPPRAPPPAPTTPLASPTASDPNWLVFSPTPQPPAPPRPGKIFGAGSSSRSSSCSSASDAAGSSRKEFSGSSTAASHPKQPAVVPTAVETPEAAATARPAVSPTTLPPPTPAATAAAPVRHPQQPQHRESRPDHRSNSSSSSTAHRPPLATISSTRHGAPSSSSYSGAHQPTTRPSAPVAPPQPRPNFMPDLSQAATEAARSQLPPAPSSLPQAWYPPNDPRSAFNRRAAPPLPTVPLDPRRRPEQQPGAATASMSPEVDQPVDASPRGPDPAGISGTRKENEFYGPELRQKRDLFAKSHRWENEMKNIVRDWEEKRLEKEQDAKERKQEKFPEGRLDCMKYVVDAPFLKTARRLAVFRTATNTSKGTRELEKDDKFNRTPKHDLLDDNSVPIRIRLERITVDLALHERPLADISSPKPAAPPIASATPAPTPSANLDVVNAHLRLPNSLLNVIDNTNNEVPLIVLSPLGERSSSNSSLIAGFDDGVIPRRMETEAEARYRWDHMRNLRRLWEAKVAREEMLEREGKQEPDAREIIRKIDDLSTNMIKNEAEQVRRLQEEFRKQAGQTRSPSVASTSSSACSNRDSPVVNGASRSTVDQRRGDESIDQRKGSRSSNSAQTISTSAYKAQKTRRVSPSSCPADPLNWRKQKSRERAALPPPVVIATPMEPPRQPTPLTVSTVHPLSTPSPGPLPAGESTARPTSAHSSNEEIHRPAAAAAGSVEAGDNQPGPSSTPAPAVPVAPAAAALPVHQQVTAALAPVTGNASVDDFKFMQTINSIAFNASKATPRPSTALHSNAPPPVNGFSASFPGLPAPGGFPHFPLLPPPLPPVNAYHVPLPPGPPPPAPAPYKAIPAPPPLPQMQMTTATAVSKVTPLKLTPYGYQAVPEEASTSKEKASTMTKEAADSEQTELPSSSTVNGANDAVDGGREEDTAEARNNDAPPPSTPSTSAVEEENETGANDMVVEEEEVEVIEMENQPGTSAGTPETSQPSGSGGDGRGNDDENEKPPGGMKAQGYPFKMLWADPSYEEKARTVSVFDYDSSTTSEQFREHFSKWARVEAVIMSTGPGFPFALVRFERLRDVVPVVSAAREEHTLHGKIFNLNTYLIRPAAL